LLVACTELCLELVRVRNSNVFLRGMSSSSAATYQRRTRSVSSRANPAGQRIARDVSDPVESAGSWGIHIRRKVCESAVRSITGRVGKMPGPLSQDLRDRLTAAVAAGSSARAAAERFGVSESTAIRWAQRWRAEDETRARPMGGDHRLRLTGHREAVLTLVAHRSDLTLAEIGAALAASTGGKAWHYRRPDDDLAVLQTPPDHRQKKVCTPPSRGGLTSPPRAAGSSSGSPPWIPST
jgi:transposase